jgi:hypothetical membrane protein
MRSWVPVSAAVAPVALIGGWTVAAGRQPAAYDPVTDTISALAAGGATDAWVMTLGLAVVGGAHVATALGLSEARLPARVVLGTGGVATVMVAVYAQPSAGHFPAATVSFVALAAWPALSGLPSRRAGLLAAGGLLGLVGWLGVELGRDQWVGLVERVAAGAQTLWPLVVVVALSRLRRGSPRSVRPSGRPQA